MRSAAKRHKRRKRKGSNFLFFATFVPLCGEMSFILTESMAPCV